MEDLVPWQYFAEDASIVEYSGENNSKKRALLGSAMMSLQYRKDRLFGQSLVYLTSVIIHIFQIPSFRSSVVSDVGDLEVRTSE